MNRYKKLVASLLFFALVLSFVVTYFARAAKIRAQEAA